MVRLPHRLIALLLLLMEAGSAPVQAGAPAAPRSFRLAQRDSTGWVFEYTPAVPLPRPVLVGGETSLLFVGGEGEPGTPQLPVEVLSLGIPPGARITAELVDPRYESLADQAVAPVPRFEPSSTGDADPVYDRAPSAYRADRFFPQNPVMTGDPYTLRVQRIAPIRIAPFLYNPATRTLRKLVHARLRIRLTGGSEAGRYIPDPGFEEVYKMLLVNAVEARQWRQSILPVRLRSDSSRAWFQPGNRYHRVAVTRDGWYRVGMRELGGENVDPVSARLFRRGAEVPLVVRGDSAVEFHGVGRLTESGAIDPMTDSTIYWLATSGSGAGRRYSDAQAPTVASPVAIDASLATRHFEGNTDYYEGTLQNEISDNGLVAGEGWVWEYYYPGTSALHTFPLDAISRTSGESARVRVRLFSTTLHYSTPDHRARFWVNDSLAGELTFLGRTEGNFAASIPAAWLREGTNTLRITSVATGSVPNQFYLDWFEIDYPRMLKATQDWLSITVPPPSGGGARITLSGFTAPEIAVVDPVAARHITGGVVGTDTTNGTYRITFDDTISSARTYVAHTPQGTQPPAGVRSKLFGDLRTLAGGADHITITHALFRSSAEQLAAYRASSLGVRTRVVDVQDVFDEFSFGDPSTEGMKAFLRHAFTQWPAPAPSSLLFFGDASWDPRRFMATSIKTNYVPAYGVPAGDNWFACFDSTHPFLPSLQTGRIPVEDPVQAARTVAKLIAYDRGEPREWNKNFLFITGGNTEGEQASFNALSDYALSTSVLPPPVGGTAFRVYKSTPDAIDGENKSLLRDLVRRGVVLLNFLGHSGGRIWGVDIGSPNELDNTGGELPFVSSVSCNAGAFAEPSNNVLAEDFLLADGRGASGVWASSSIGYAGIGSSLVDFFLEGVARDTVRSFGALTTSARYRLWQARGSDYTTIASMNLNPLLGDPLTRLAIPRLPDLAVAASDVSVLPASPTPLDSTLRIRVALHNYGLTPPDSVDVLIDDLFGGATVPVDAGHRLPPTRHHDSLVVPWNGGARPGMHQLRVQLDPSGRITEVRKTNNSATVSQTVYSNRLTLLRPFADMVVLPGPVTLVVGKPLGREGAGVRYEFEVDTTRAFDSPGCLRSGAIAGGVTGGRWTTPSLQSGRAYVWRARATVDTLVGRWSVATFQVAADAPALPLARWRQSTPLQFSGGLLNRLAVADSGVGIAPRPPLRLGVRSLGYRASMDRDYYSTLRINEQTIIGYWWVLGGSFLVARVNEFTGKYDFQAFDVAARATDADAMQRFLEDTPAGSYVIASVVFDGWSNVTPGLRGALHALGSSMIDSVLPGHAWSFIGRKGTSGPAMTPLEHWSGSGVTEDSLGVATYFSAGSGTFAASPLPPADRYATLRWDPGTPGGTDARLVLTGSRRVGVDTLLTVLRDSSYVPLGSVAALRDTAYQSVALVAALATSDALFTPTLRSWSVDLEPAADLAVVTQSGLQAERGARIDLAVHLENNGFRAVDSARVIVAALLPDGGTAELARTAVGPIPVDGEQDVVVTVATGALASRSTLAVSVENAAGRELTFENNTAYVALELAPPGSWPVIVSADGARLVEGDYVASHPLIRVRPVLEGVPHQRSIQLLVDGQPIASAGGDGVQEGWFRPALAAGTRDVVGRVIDLSLQGVSDTLQQRTTVTVSPELRILQLFAFPNPFAAVTQLTFVLAGSDQPERTRIRIFTVAGRRIRLIDLQGSAARIGVNRVPWDGRDDDGDLIANGVYFCQVEVLSGGKTVTAIGKLAKVR